MSRFISCFELEDLQAYFPGTVAKATKLTGEGPRTKAQALQLAREIGLAIQKQNAEVMSVVSPGETFTLEEAIQIPEGGESVDINPNTIAGIQKIMKEAKEHGVNRKAIWDDHLKTMMTRTPGTGKHSVTNAKVTLFLDNSNNAVFVPSKLLTVKGADQDIDKEVMIQLQPWIVNGNVESIPYAADVTPEIMASDKESDMKFMRVALQNESVRAALKILENQKNSYEAHQSVEAELGRMKELAKRVPQKEREHFSYADSVEMQHENYAGKSLISIFANLQKVYLSVAEVYTLTDDSMGFQEVTEKVDRASIKIAGLINAATDAVKERILASLNVTVNNGPLVGYWLVKEGVSIDEIVMNRLDPKKEPELAKYFDEVQKAKRHDSEISPFDVSPPKKWANDITEAQVMSSFASILPNTSDSAPKSMEEFASFHRKFARIMDNLGQKNFSIFDYLSSSEVDQNELMLQVSKRNKGKLNPLKLIRSLPHIRSYLGLINMMHQKHMELLPAYRFVFMNNLKNSRFEFNTFSVFQAFAERFFKVRNIKAKEISDGDKRPLSMATPDGRQDFVTKMHDSFVPMLMQKYRGNPFVKILSVFDYTSTADGRGEDMDERKIQLSEDLSTLSPQRIAEIRAGFESLQEWEKENLFYYALMSDGLRELPGSYSALFNAKNSVPRQEWNNFLDKDLAGKIDPFIKPQELVKQVTNGKRSFANRVGKGYSKLALPFELVNLNEKETASTYDAFLKESNKFEIVGDKIKTKTQTYSDARFKAQLVSAALDSRNISEKQQDHAMRIIQRYLAKTPIVGLTDVEAEENIEAIRQLVESDKEEERAIEIEAAELLSRLITGRSPQDYTSQDITIIEDFYHDFELLKTQGNFGRISIRYKNAFNKLMELTQLTADERISTWEKYMELKKLCG